MAYFDYFNWPKTVKKITLTPGYSDSSGNWVFEQTSETEISAHISDISVKEMQYLDPGIVERGTRKLSCEESTDISVGDRIKITELDGTTETEWLVNSLLSSTGVLNSHLNISRQTFLLVKAG